MESTKSFRSPHLVSSSQTPRRDVISIRSLSYQKSIDPPCLQDQFYKTQQFPVKSSVQLHLHKLSKNKGWKNSAYSTMTTLKENGGALRMRQKTSFNFDSINYNTLIKTKERPPFFLNFIQGKLESGNLHPQCKHPNDSEIQQEYRLKLPVLIPPLENQNIYINFLMGFSHSFEFLEKLIEGARKLCSYFIEQKDELLKEMNIMRGRFEDELKELLINFRKIFEKFEMKDDFIKNQNENFRLQKEITLLQRDKINLEGEIENSLKRIKEIENKVFRIELFDLQTDDPLLKTIGNRNLRPEHNGVKEMGLL